MIISLQNCRPLSHWSQVPTDGSENCRCLFNQYINNFHLLQSDIFFFIFGCFLLSSSLPDGCHMDGGMGKFSIKCFIFLTNTFYACPTCSQNQFFISGLSGDEHIRNRVLEALYARIKRAHTEKKCFRVIIVIPLLPGFQVAALGCLPSVFHFQYIESF